MWFTIRRGLINQVVFNHSSSLALLNELLQLDFFWENVVSNRAHTPGMSRIMKSEEPEDLFLVCVHVQV